MTRSRRARLWMQCSNWLSSDFLDQTLRIHVKVRAFGTSAHNGESAFYTDWRPPSYLD